jgi:hypothetical protein
MDLPYLTPINIIDIGGIDPTKLFFNAIREVFCTYLSDITASLYPGEYEWNTGLNCRYGIELEFYHINNDQPTSRYVLGNKVNNCIFNQNSNDFFKYRFNPDHPTDTILTQQLAYNATTLPNSIGINTNMDEWSNFLTEVMSDYHAPTHIRSPVSIADRGDSGFKIEEDPHVTFNDIPPPNLSPTMGPAPNGYRDDIYYGLVMDGRNTDKLTIWKSDDNLYLDDVISTARSGTAEIKIIDLYEIADLTISCKTELVSPKLIDEPFLMNGKYVPYGVIAMDNIITHMKNHNSILFVQNDGLHIHISKNTKMSDALGGNQISVAEAVGFAKLFWLFEPLFVAGEPRYRSENDIIGYQSFQSLFNLQEILDETDDTIYRVLTTNGGLNGVNRRLADVRYTALNFDNLVPPGIGTIEYRIGHGTFDGKAIQLHTHLLQVLFQFSNSILLHCRTNDIDPNDIYTSLFKNARDIGAIPYYCEYPSQVYDTLPIKNFLSDYRLWSFTRALDDLNENLGSPIYGFFRSCYGMDHRSYIIKSLASLFVALTGACDGIDTLLDYINLYHTDIGVDIDGFPHYNIPTDLDPIVISDYRPYIDIWNQKPFDMYHYRITLSIPFVPYEMFATYNPTRLPRSTNLVHPSPTCSISNVTHQPHTTIFNNGINPLERNRIRNTVDDTLNDAHLFKDSAIHGRYGKTQSELLNHKKNITVSGGKNKRKYIHKTKRKYIHKTKKNRKGGNQDKIKPKKIDKPVLLNFKANINKELDPYDMTILSGKVILSRPIKFTSEKKIDERLSSTVTNLLTKKIISLKQLELLIRMNYIEPFLYLHEPTLLSVLKRIPDLNMTEDLFKRIQSEYTLS